LILPSCAWSAMVFLFIHVPRRKIDSVLLTGESVKVLQKDGKYIDRAIKLAEKGAGLAFPNPMVGAVIVKDGAIVGEGFHRGAGGNHAEINALNQAGKKAKNGTLYLNLEPCCHFGKTPPCTEAIIAAEIKRVVFSTYDPDERVRGKGSETLLMAGVEVVSGVRAEEALELNLGYVHKKITGKAFITLKLASTLNGYLGVKGRRWLTDMESRRVAHRFRNESEAIAVGIGTIERDEPRLDRRLWGGGVPPPIRMVFDTNLKFSPHYRWLRNGERVMLFCGENVSVERASQLSEAGAEVIKLPLGDGGIDLESWIEDISERGIISVLVEGGGRVATSLLAKGLFDRLIVFYAPLLSGRDEVSWYNRENRPLWPQDGGLAIKELRKLKKDFYVVYDVNRIKRYREMVTKEQSIVYGSDNQYSTSDITR
jgi:diaminohydroxyphosphoribosylaminopyrimidine deaminase/5-amino-6-(5-phosphoribosylamino)uracil reductase